MSYLNEVTVVIPTHERHFLLKRCISYLIKSDIACKIIIVDSSSVIFDEQLPDNFQYINVSEQNIMLDSGYLRKLEGVVEGIVTPYTLMLADDDFLVRPSIEKAYAFLEQNRDFESAQGVHFTIRAECRFKAIDINNAEIPNEYLNASPLSRMQALSKSYFNNFYALQRTRCWKNFFQEISPVLSQFNCFRCYTPCIGELVQAMCCVFSGRHKVLLVPWLFREYIPGTGGLITNKVDNITEWEDFRAFCGAFADVLNCAYQGGSNIESSDLENAFHSYFAGTETHLRSDALNVDWFMDETQCSQELVLIKQIINDNQKIVAKGLKKLLGKDYALKNLYCDNWYRLMFDKIVPFVCNRETIVIYGAGEHTRYLLEVVEDIDSTVQIYLTDSNPKNLSDLNLPDIKTVLPTQITEVARHVIISSQSYQSEIKEKLESIYGDRLTLLLLY